MGKWIDRISLKYINLVYWLLLFYLIAALAWWYIELDQQNDLMLAFQLEQVQKLPGNTQADVDKIKDAHQRNARQYIGEGLTFLLLTMVGAWFVYQAVRRQIRLHLQQKNFMLAVTHELKTPIAVAKLSLETLKRHKLDPEKQDKILVEAIHETDRLDALCNNILLSSQLESGGYTLNKAEFNCSEMVEDAVASFSKRNKSRLIEHEISKNLWVFGEEFLLRLVLNNLLENAVKYTPNGTPIRVEAFESEHQIQIRVMDQGAGIPDLEKSKIFEKFYRLEDESKRKTKGTGLGLYLSSRIISDHGGNLRIENNKPHGSVFILEIPKLTTYERS
jgi:signal transduction histidine kinase